MSPCERLVIEERHVGQPAREEALLASHADAIGIPVVRMTWKPFLRHRVTPEAGDVVAGSVAFVRSALHSLGKALPPPNPYPPSLEPWLHRRVWKVSTLGEALASRDRVFVKPAKRWKLFTGLVIDSPNPPELHGASRREPVWCSEPVLFLSEWRAYVVNSALRFLGLSDNGGDREHCPGLPVVLSAIAAYRGAPSAYAIDFGVLSSGETALVEVNDGFSVGAYDGIAPETYFDFTAMRWMEMSQ